MTAAAPQIRVCRPQLPDADQLRPYLDEIDRSGQYTNFGPLLPRIPQMDCQFDDLLGRFCHKNQCNTIIATGQTRLTLRVTRESSLCGSISTAA